MPECLVCQESMEEINLYVTECCGAERMESEDVCPLCGAENPIIVMSAPIFHCGRCGFTET